VNFPLKSNDANIIIFAGGSKQEFSHDAETGYLTQPELLEINTDF
jgi:hypothetical protein